MVSEEIRAMIPDYVRGLLSPSDMKEVEAAMNGSPEILQEFEAAQVYYAALNQIPEVKAPPDFISRVNRMIDHQSFVSRFRRFFFEPLHIKLPIELAGVTIGLVVILAVHYPFQPRERLSVRSAPVMVHRKAAPAVPAPPRQAEEKREARVTESPAPAEHPVQAPATIAFSAKNQAQKEPLPRVAVAAAVPPMRAEPKPEATEARPAGAAPLRPSAPSTSVPSIDAIPPLTASVRSKETESPETANNIGTVELTYIMPENGEIGQASGGESITAAAASATETILRTYDRHFIKSFQNSTVTYVCTFPPGRLSALIEDLGRSFSVTTHLFSDEAQQNRLITVSVILQ
jgi:hypothetical protein